MWPSGLILILTTTVVAPDLLGDLYVYEYLLIVVDIS